MADLQSLSVVAERSRSDRVPFVPKEKDPQITQMAF